MLLCVFETTVSTNMNTTENITITKRNLYFVDTHKDGHNMVITTNTGGRKIYFWFALVVNIFHLCALVATYVVCNETSYACSICSMWMVCYSIWFPDRRKQPNLTYVSCLRNLTK